MQIPTRRLYNNNTIWLNFERETPDKLSRSIHLAIVDCLHGCAVADDVAAGKHPWRRLSDVVVEVDSGAALFVELQRRACLAQRIVDLRAKRRDDEVALDANELIFVLVQTTLVVELGLVHLERADVTVLVANHLLWRAERQPFTFLFFRCFSLKYDYIYKKVCVFFLKKKHYKNVNLI